MRIASTAVAILSLLAAPALGAQGVRITMLPWNEPILLDTLRQEQFVDIPAAKAYEAAHKVLAEFEIPEGTTDGKAGFIASERFQRRLNLAGSPMSSLFECGDGPTGPYANSFRLEIAIAVYIKPQGEGTMVGVATVAAARDPAGTSRAARRCASTGALEDKLARAIAKRAKAP